MNVGGARGVRWLVLFGVLFSDAEASASSQADDYANAQAAVNQAVINLALGGQPVPPGFNVFLSWDDSRPYGHTVRRAFGGTIYLGFSAAQKVAPNLMDRPEFWEVIIEHEYDHVNGTLPWNDPCADIASYPGVLAKLCTSLEFLVLEAYVTATEHAEWCAFYDDVKEGHNDCENPAFAMGCLSSFTPIPDCSACP